MTRTQPPFDWTMPIAFVVVLLIAVFVPGCSQPPEADAPPAPVSVTAPIGQALSDVEAIPPLALDIRDDAKALTPDNVPTLAPRIERNADEVIDHARAASAKLSETQATSRANDKRVAELQGVVAKLQAANAKLAEQVERERQSATQTLKLVTGGAGVIAIGVGVVLIITGKIWPALVACVGGVTAIGLATFWHQVAIVGIVIGGLALIAAVVWFVMLNRKTQQALSAKAEAMEQHLRRTIQSIEHTAQNAYATVKDVKRGIAIATDDEYAAIVRDETRPAGK